MVGGPVFAPEYVRVRAIRLAVIDRLSWIGKHRAEQPVSHGSSRKLTRTSKE